MTAGQLAIAFLGSVLPEELCSRLPACSSAANKDVYNLVKALHQVSQVTPSIFSVQPMGAYSKSRQIVVFAGRRPLGSDTCCQLIPFINVIFLKQATVGLANFLYLMSWLWSNRRRDRCIIVHNLYPPMSLPVLLATKLLGGKSVALVSDLPHNMSYDFRGVRGKLQKLDWLVETRALARFSGIIAYTRFIGEDHAPHVPMLVMEGGVDPDEANPGSATDAASVSANERIVCFTGTLSTVNGIELLLDAFRLLPDPDYRLWIFGRGPLESLVRDAAERDGRIIYFGFVPDQADVLRHQRKATVLINLRLQDSPINRYTFPSKLREYMLSARPVISTTMPGIPDEYHKFVHILREETPLGLITLLREVFAKPSIELSEFGLCAREFALRNKDWTIQGQRVYEFICEL